MSVRGGKTEAALTRGNLHRARDAVKEAVQKASRGDVELCEHGRRAEAALLACFEIHQAGSFVAREGSRKALSVLTSLK